MIRIPTLFLLPFLQAPGTAAQTPKSAQPKVPESKVPATKVPESKASKPAPDAKQDAKAPWTNFRTKLEERLKADRKRLKNLLEQAYLSDLNLNYNDRDNRAYLERKITELSRADPDIGGLLVELLDPRSGATSLQYRADNAVRILERIDIAPYRGRLRKMLTTPSYAARLRALRLLCDIKDASLVPVLKRYMSEAPEVSLPKVLDCVGRYGDPQLAASVLPFLSRPNESQAVAALRALARLRSPSAIGPATQAVEKLDTDRGYSALLGLLDACSNKLDATDTEAFVGATLAVLKKAGKLGPREVLKAQELLAGIDEKRLQPLLAPIRPTIKELLDHRYPAVQFAAANLLFRHGDKSGRKHVLDRLNAFVRKNKGVPYAYFQRAQAHRSFAKLSDALRDINQAIKHAAGADPGFHFFAAELEVVRGSSANVTKHLKAADPTAEELTKFRKDNPRIEDLLTKSRQLRKVFEKK